MSEITKQRIKQVKNSLTDANDYVTDAAYYAGAVGDKALVEKIEKVKSSIKETNEYIESRTGKNS